MRVPSWWPEGYDRARPSADGRESWVARERDSGATVTMRPLPAGSDVRSIAGDPGRVVVVGPEGWVLVTVIHGEASQAGSPPSRRRRLVAVVTVVLVATIGGLASAHTVQVSHLASMPAMPTRTPGTPTSVPIVPGAPTLAPPSAQPRGHPRGRTALRWWRVVAALDRRRAAAFEARDWHLLLRVYPPGSALLRTDRRTIDILRRDGVRPRGLRLRLVSVRSARAQRDRVRLRVSDVLPAYVLVERDGRTVRRPGRGSRAWLVQLVRVAGTWRISSEQRS